MAFEHGRIAIYHPDAERIGPGIYNLSDVKDRCRVDEDTGCWHLGMSIPKARTERAKRCPRMSLPEGVITGVSPNLTAPKIVWLMSGRVLHPKWIVWRNCQSDDCCTPRHLMAGTRADWGEWVAAGGGLRGKPHRLVANRKNFMKLAVPADVVRQILELVEAGASCAEAGAAFGVHEDAVGRMVRGVHATQRLAHGASVFNMA